MRLGSYGSLGESKGYSKGDDGSQLEPSAGQKRKAEMSIPYLTPASKTARISSKEAEDA